MQRRWVVERADGGITILASGHLEQVATELQWTGTEAELLAWIVAKDVPPGDTAILMPVGWVSPADRTFRNSWRRRGQSAEAVVHTECDRIEVDLPHAREHWRKILRAERRALLADLDTAYLRADEAGDQAEKRRIAAEKQRLRDITNDPRIDAAQTVDDLKQITVERGV